VVESTALEMRHRGNSIGGSNPSLSASPPLRTPPTAKSDACFPAVAEGFHDVTPTSETAAASIFGL
jgi:hypothetical protein